MDDAQLLARPISEGDLVIVDSGERLTPLRVRAGETLSIELGAFAHAAMLGLAFGSAVRPSGRGGGAVTLLAPTPELWSLALPHRTQVLYVADVSTIIARLHLRPGSTVIEAGTGSGALSTAIMRTVAPSGHLYTFEFNERRCALAREEFAANGLGALCTVTYGDVCDDGFDFHAAVPALGGGAAADAAADGGGPSGGGGGGGGRSDGGGRTDACVDAVILDLPAPWRAVRAISAVLRPGGRLCTFSPCIEQVQKTAAALSKGRYTNVTVVEGLVRLLPVVRDAQPDFARGDSRGAEGGAARGQKRARPGPAAAPSPPPEAPAAAAAAEAIADPMAALRAAQRARGGPALAARGGRTASVRAGGEQRGHTGYLLFALRPPNASLGPATAAEV